MQQRRSNPRRLEAGIVLISSLLLLLVVTIMALSMFRSFGVQERIAGNMREKQRALQVALSTQQYAEWWLANESSAPRAVALGVASAADVQCAPPLQQAIVAGAFNGQICLNSLASATGIAGLTPATWPTYNTSVGVGYTPPNLRYTGSGAVAGVTDIYYQQPRFYITDLGALATGRGEIYQVDAYSYGLSNTTMAVVESTVAVTCVVCNIGGL